MNFMVCKLGTGQTGLIMVPCMQGLGTYFAKAVELTTESPTLLAMVTKSMKASPNADAVDFPRYQLFWGTDKDLAKWTVNGKPRQAAT